MLLFFRTWIRTRRVKKSDPTSPIDLATALQAPSMLMEDARHYNVVIDQVRPRRARWATDLGSGWAGQSSTTGASDEILQCSPAKRSSIAILKDVMAIRLYAVRTLHDTPVCTRPTDK